VTRLTLGSLAVLGLAGGALLLLARLRGRRSGRGSVLFSLVSGWLGAYAVWTFLGGLALQAGWLARYDAALFGPLALALGAWQYRTQLRGGREPAVAIFVGGQLAWLLIVALQNGLLGR
jgi:hypothetical protein